MPVLAIFEQPNLDEGTYAAMLEQLMPVLRSARGFMSHAGGPSPAGGTRIIEIWESEADSQQLFSENLTGRHHLAYSRNLAGARDLGVRYSHQVTDLPEARGDRPARPA